MQPILISLRISSCVIHWCQELAGIVRKQELVFHWNSLAISWKCRKLLTFDLLVPLLINQTSVRLRSLLKSAVENLSDQHSWILGMIIIALCALKTFFGIWPFFGLDKRITLRSPMTTMVHQNCLLLICFFTASLFQLNNVEFNHSYLVAVMIFPKAAARTIPGCITKQWWSHIKRLYHRVVCVVIEDLCWPSSVYSCHLLSYNSFCSYVESILLSLWKTYLYRSSIYTWHL